MSPRVSFISVKVFNNLKGATKRIKVAGISLLMSLTLLYNCFLCPGLSGGYPKNINLSGANPLRVRAVITEEGPGRESTSMFCARHSLTNLYPGSEIRGVPASEIKQIFAPFFSCSITWGTILNSLKSFKIKRGFLIS